LDIAIQIPPRQSVAQMALNIFGQIDRIGGLLHFGLRIPAILPQKMPVFGAIPARIQR
jgi:hypothetical protein